MSSAATHGAQEWWTTAASVWAPFTVVGAVVVLWAVGVRRKWERLPRYMLSMAVCLVPVALAMTPLVLREQNDEGADPSAACGACGVVVVGSLLVALGLWGLLSGDGQRWLMRRRQHRDRVPVRCDPAPNGDDTWLSTSPFPRPTSTTLSWPPPDGPVRRHRSTEWEPPK